MGNQNVFLKMMAALALMFPVVSSSTRVKADGTDGLTRGQIEAGVEEYFASVGSLDPQRLANNFAPDGVFEDPVGTPLVQGTQAIAAFFGATAAQLSEIKPYIQEIIVGGQEAIVNWKLRLKTTSGKIIFIDGMGVFKFNQQGKLQSVRVLGSGVFPGAVRGLIRLVQTLIHRIGAGVQFRKRADGGADPLVTA